jgi:septal ring factor EnvC (AmiA/AmiB activator)
LAVRNAKGEVDAIRFDSINAMLLNEFLKEHRKVEEQESKIDSQQATITELKSTVAEQQNDIKTVVARVQEQAVQLQKVTAQIEMGKAAQQIVINP